MGKGAQSRGALGQDMDLPGPLKVYGKAEANDCMSQDPTDDNLGSSQTHSPQASVNCVEQHWLTLRVTMAEGLWDPCFVVCILGGGGVGERAPGRWQWGLVGWNLLGVRKAIAPLSCPWRL